MVERRPHARQPVERGSQRGELARRGEAHADPRAEALVGRTVVLPIVGREIPIVADDYVVMADPESSDTKARFASGFLKVTPAHDPNDYEIGKRHNLPMINGRTVHASINDETPEAYRGMDRYSARKQIVEDLQKLDLLEKIEDYTVKIPRGDRSHAVVEPYLTDQWYVKIAPLAKPAIEAVENGRIEFVPENWSKTYFEWMRNIQDWCISRQLWWGQRIPAWYYEDKVFVAETDAHVLGVSLDGAANRAGAEAFIERHDLPFPNLIGEPQRVMLKYLMLTQSQFRGTPSILLYDPAGKLRAAQAGAVPTASIEAYIARDSGKADTAG